mmetsp:Transcript_6035/g.18193  ORF Transcript_6035/g.18193 Transcript_6035/m.18193 type:complete len:308 (+) Transcript_6035:1821-2744(+)
MCAVAGLPVFCLHVLLLLLLFTASRRIVEEAVAVKVEVLDQQGNVVLLLRQLLLRPAVTEEEGHQQAGLYIEPRRRKAVVVGDHHPGVLVVAVAEEGRVAPGRIGPAVQRPSIRVLEHVSAVQVHHCLHLWAHLSVVNDGVVHGENVVSWQAVDPVDVHGNSQLSLNGPPQKRGVVGEDRRGLQRLCKLVPDDLHDLNVHVEGGALYREEAHVGFPWFYGPEVVLELSEASRWLGPHIRWTPAPVPHYAAPVCDRLLEDLADVHITAGPARLPVHDRDLFEPAHDPVVSLLGHLVEVVVRGHTAELA